MALNWGTLIHPVVGDMIDLFGTSHTPLINQQSLGEVKGITSNLSIIALAVAAIMIFRK